MKSSLDPTLFLSTHLPSDTLFIFETLFQISRLNEFLICLFPKIICIAHFRANLDSSEKLPLSDGAPVFEKYLSVFILS